MKQSNFIVLVALYIGCSSSPMLLAERICNIKDYGAVGDGKTLCTQAIQEAIDRCAADGGGTVFFPAGDWLTGALILRSHIALELDAGCRVLGSIDPADYPPPKARRRSV